MTRKPLTPDQLVPDKWYYCNAKPIQQEVQFKVVEKFGALEGMAYVEFKDDDGAVTGYYVSVKTLEEL